MGQELAEDLLTKNQPLLYLFLNLKFLNQDINYGFEGNISCSDFFFRFKKLNLRLEATSH